MKTRGLLLLAALTLGAAGCYSSFNPTGPGPDLDGGPHLDAGPRPLFDAGPRPRSDAGADSGTARDAAAVDAPPVSPFTGRYEGTYTGSSSGEVFVEIRPDGTLTVELRAPGGAIQRHEGTIRVDGALNASGRIGALMVTFDGHFSGEPGAHTGTGTWRIGDGVSGGTWQLHQVA